MWQWLIVILVGLPLAWFARWWIRSARRFRLDAREDHSQQSKDALFFWCYRPVAEEVRSGRWHRLMARKSGEGGDRPFSAYM